jgi:hypothetical protein
METGECERRIAANQDTIWCSQFLDQNTVITGGADIRVRTRPSLCPPDRARAGGC